MTPQQLKATLTELGWSTTHLAHVLGVGAKTPSNWTTGRTKMPHSIGVAFTHPKAGPMTMRLTPMKGTDTFGRDGFLIHGDKMSVNHTASNGCII